MTAAFQLDLDVISIFGVFCLFGVEFMLLKQNCRQGYLSCVKVLKFPGQLCLLHSDECKQTRDRLLFVVERGQVFPIQLQVTLHLMCIIKQMLFQGWLCCLRAQKRSVCFQFCYIGGRNYVGCLIQLRRYNLLLKATVGMQRASEKYSYISHPDNWPLELNGSSKKRVNSLRKEDFNAEKCTLNEQSRSILMKKLSQGKYDFQKSILPGSDSRKTSRPTSIKTFNANKQNIQSSGIEYLMQKTENANPITHKQRAHVKQSCGEPAKPTSKKHFVPETDQSRKQEQRRPLHHRDTQTTKLAQDIYSNAYRMEKEPVVKRKVETNNYFRRGQELGFEEKRVRKFSDMKMIEMVGSEHVRAEKGGVREKRQDWRISNITFF